MNHLEAKKIVREQNPTWGQIKDILRAARSQMKPAGWRGRSVTNSSFSKGAAFNVFWKGLVHHDDNQRVMDSRVWFIAAYVIREFREYSGYTVNRPKKNLPEIHHEDPVELEEK